MMKLMMMLLWQTSYEKRERVPPRKSQAFLVVISYPTTPRGQELPLGNAKQPSSQLMMMMNNQGKSSLQIRKYFSWILLVLVFLMLSLSYFSSVAASNPKLSKRRVEVKVVRDDTATEQVVQSVAVGSSLNVAGDGSDAPHQGRHRPRLASWRWRVLWVLLQHLRYSK
jgi:hypothetical protein